MSMYHTGYSVQSTSTADGLAICLPREGGLQVLVRTTAGPKRIMHLHCARRHLMIV